MYKQIKHYKTAFHIKQYGRLFCIRLNFCINFCKFARNISDMDVTVLKWKSIKTVEAILKIQSKGGAKSCLWEN
jgi:hypothetical protein